MTMLTVLPIPVKRALQWCAEVHRRLPRLQGAMWAIAALRDARIVGVAIVGRPTARMLDSANMLPQPALSILRVACNPDDKDPDHQDSQGRPHKGANSILYGACARAARTMGCTDLSTYIHHDESGISLRAAGWIKDTEHESRGGTYDRPSRARAPGRRWSKDPLVGTVVCVCTTFESC